MKFISLFFILFMSFQVFSREFVCMNEMQAGLNQCLPYPYAEGNEYCKSRGETLAAYTLSNNCSHHLVDEESLVEATCLVSDVAEKNHCEDWYYEPAKNYCGKLYGEQYLPYLTSKKCTQSLADDNYGYITNLDKIQPQLDSLYSMISLMDRQPLEDKFGSYLSMRPIISKDWNHPMTQKLITLMMKVKTEITERSFLKLKSGSGLLLDLLLGSKQYMNLLRRVYTLYAFTAHREKELTKSFKDLAYLNLVVSSDFYKLLLTLETYPSKNVGNKTVEIHLSSTDKQTAEYNALKTPNSKEEYAKLIQFMGLRENLHNLWGINELTEENILDQRLPRCEQTLSFNGSGEVFGFESVDENIRGDYFYEVYIENIDELSAVLENITLVKDEDIEVLKKIYNQSEKFKAEVEENVTKNKVETYLKKDLEGLKNFVNDAWLVHLNNELKSILLPQDMNKSLEEQVSIIMKTMKNIKTQRFTEGLKAMYNWLPSKTFELIDSIVKKHFSAWEDLQFEMSTQIHSALERIKSKQRKPEERLSSRIESIYKTLKENISVLNNWQDSFVNDQFKSPVIRSTKEIIFLLKLRASRTKSHFYKAFTEGEEQTKMIQSLIIELDKKLSSKYKDEIDRISSDSDLKINQEIKEYIEKKYAAAELNDLVKNHRIKAINPFSSQEGQSIVHFTELYQSFEESLYMEIDKIKSVHRMNQMFGLSFEQVDERVDLMSSVEKIEDLYFLSLDITANELMHYKKNQKTEKKTYKNLEFFDLLQLEGDYLELTRKEEVELIKWRLDILVQNDIFLGMHIERKEKVKKVSTPHKNSTKVTIYYENELKKRPIAEHMAIRLREDQDLNKAYLTAMIKEILNESKQSIQNSLSDFCQADYLKNKEAFKKLFSASVALRKSIKEEKDKIYRGTPVEEFDKEIEDELRTNLEKINDDILEPVLIGAGILTLLFFASPYILPLIGFKLSASGIAGVITAFGITPMMINLGNVSMLSLISITTTVHLNRNLIKIPAQIKYQEKLVNTQVLNQTLINEKLIKDQKESNQLGTLMTIGFIPFDLFYGVSTFKALKKDMGIYGLEGVKKLTGLNGTIKQSTDRVGRRVTIKSDLRQRYNSYRKRKLQEKPYWLNDDLLRFGLTRAMINSDLALPQLKKKLNNLREKWMKKLDFYEEIDELSGEQKIKWTLRSEEGLEFLKVKHKQNPVSYWLRTELKAIKSGNYQEFKRLNGSRADELRELREQALEKEIIQLEELVYKMSSYLNKGGEESINLLNFFKELSSDEISKLNDYLKLDGEDFDHIFKEFKKVKELEAHYLADNPYYNDLKTKRSVYITDPLDFDEDVKLFNEFLVHIAR